MCCGKNRELLRQSAPAKIDENPIGQEPGAASPYATTAPRNSVFGVSAADRGTDCVFECKSNFALIAVGGATGARYYFSGAGNRVKIDARDRKFLSMMDALVEVENPESAS